LGFSWMLKVFESREATGIFTIDYSLVYNFFS
jgi:hypothetical protein